MKMAPLEFMRWAVRACVCVCVCVCVCAVLGLVDGSCVGLCESMSKFFVWTIQGKYACTCESFCRCFAAFVRAVLASFYQCCYTVQ